MWLFTAIQQKKQEVHVQLHHIKTHTMTITTVAESTMFNTIDDNCNGRITAFRGKTLYSHIVFERTDDTMSQISWQDN